MKRDKKRRASGVGTDQIILEITESFLILSIEQVFDTLED